MIWRRKGMRTVIEFKVEVCKLKRVKEIVNLGAENVTGGGGGVPVRRQGASGMLNVDLTCSHTCECRPTSIEAVSEYSSEHGPLQRQPLSMWSYCRPDHTYPEPFSGMTALPARDSE